MVCDMNLFQLNIKTSGISSLNGTEWRNEHSFEHPSLELITGYGTLWSLKWYDAAGPETSVHCYVRGPCNACSCSVCTYNHEDPSICRIHAEALLSSCFVWRIMLCSSPFRVSIPFEAQLIARHSPPPSTSCCTPRGPPPFPSVGVVGPLVVGGDQRRRGQDGDVGASSTLTELPWSCLVWVAQT